VGVAIAIVISPVPTTSVPFSLSFLPSSVAADDAPAIARSCSSAARTWSEVRGYFGRR
jgi:hypothetical protein